MFKTLALAGTALALAPLAPESAFWLSCMHEPSLNPAFGPFLELMPADLRRKASFTTNFAKKLDDTLLRTIPQSGAHSVRIEETIIVTSTALAAEAEARVQKVHADALV